MLRTAAHLLLHARLETAKHYTLGAVNRVAVAAVARADHLLLEQLQPDAEKQLPSKVATSS